MAQSKHDEIIDALTKIQSHIEQQNKNVDLKLISQPLPGIISLTAIIMAVVTFLSIIIGMYGDIFDQFIRDNEKPSQYYSTKLLRSLGGSEDNEKPSQYCFIKLFNPQNYFSFFKEQKEYSKKDYVNPIIELTKNDSLYNHLLLIDRTMSTVFIDKDAKKQWTHFKDSLSNSLNTNIQSNIKSLLITKLHLQLFQQNNSHSFYSWFYDGYLKNDPLEGERFTNARIVDTVNFRNEKVLIDTFQLLNAQYYNNYKEQKTNILHILKKIKKHCEYCEKFEECKENIVTIVSDFDHESKEKISLEQIVELLQTKTIKPKQINIIYLVPDDPNKKIKSDKIVKKIRHCIEGTRQNYIEISTKDFIDDNFDEDLYKAFKLNLTQFFAYVESESNPVIKFYHPRTNKDYSTAECRLIFKDITSPDTSDFHWRVVTPFQNNVQQKEGTFIAYNNGVKKESSFEINGMWNTEKMGDTLQIKIPLTPRIYERFDLEIISGKICKRYSIQFDKYIPYPVAILGEMMIFALLYILCLYSILLTRYIYKSKKTKIKIQLYNYIAISIILLISILGVALCFNWPLFGCVIGSLLVVYLKEIINWIKCKLNKLKK